jgi:isoamylase
MNDSWPYGRLSPGAPLPFGAQRVADGVRFSLPAVHAHAVDLLVFHPGEYEPFVVLPFPEEHRVGGVWAMTVTGPLPEEFDYGYRVHRPGTDDGGPILSDLRAGLRRPGRLGQAGRAGGSLSLPGQARARGVRLGRGPAAADPAARPGDL